MIHCFKNVLRSSKNTGYCCSKVILNSYIGKLFKVFPLLSGQQHFSFQVIKVYRLKTSRSSAARRINCQIHINIRRGESCHSDDGTFNVIDIKSGYFGRGLSSHSRRSFLYTFCSAPHMSFPASRSAFFSCNIRESSSICRSWQKIPDIFHCFCQNVGSPLAGTSA